jgi:hypothetical protein
MFKKSTNRFAILLFTLFIISCSSGEDYYTPESVVEANAKYMNEEKYDEAMNTIHKDSPAFPATESMLKQLFDRYDLNYKLVSLKVLEDNDSEAKIQFVQVTTKLAGPEFKNNQATGIHTLKKDGNSWKIFSTEMTNVQLLDE